MKMESFLVLVILLTVGWSSPAGETRALALDGVLADENKAKKLAVAPVLNDLAFLRRVTVDLLARIPTEAEIQQYLAWPTGERRRRAVEVLLQDDRFAERWAIFYADMLRVRSNADGGAAWLAYLYKATKEGMPYDVMCRNLITASGKANKTPEVGFILGDSADPMALAASTAQVFMGIRISCAQCHDHPFDHWTREQFYGLAAFFGKTRRVENSLTRSVYTMEANESQVLWPPEDKAQGAKRRPVKAEFPFPVRRDEQTTLVAARLASVRSKPAHSANQETSLDELLDNAGKSVQKRLDSGRSDPLDVAAEAQKAARDLRVEEAVYQASKLRRELAELVTSPGNDQFARALVNRVWAELLGRGFVQPVDDFNDNNPPSHPRALNFLTEQFVAQGYDLRALVQSIVTSETYQRGQLLSTDLAEQQAAEEAFTSVPPKRMLAEAIFDSVVQAGHLFTTKYPAGRNLRTVRNLVRVPIEDAKSGKKSSAGKGQVAALLDGESGNAMRAGAGAMNAGATSGSGGGYDLESAIEVNFDALLRDNEKMVEKMEVMSREELEARRMVEQRNVKYIEKYVESTVDDNPRFASALRMASPAPPPHFLRVFGQPAREALGDARDSSPSMRQALMMLNGKITHEAARVGDLEPIQRLLVGAKADLPAAIRLAYREILTREPNYEEMTEARALLANAESPREGMADLRWILFNCHEFRFLP